MKNFAVVSSFVLAAVASVLAPGVGNAAQLPCVTKLMSNMQSYVDTGCDVPTADMKLVVVSKNGSWVSFSNDYIRLVSGRAVASHIDQTFSDRHVTSSVFSQNFAITKADDISISINPATAVLTFTNHTWSNTPHNITMACNGDALVGSDSAYIYTVIHRPTPCVL
jgi:hypothetical protein